MIYDRNRTFSWKICENDENSSRWSVLYATLNRDGDIVLSRFTHESLGSPTKYLLMFDQIKRVIGLKPAMQSERQTFAATPRGKHGGRRIRAYRLCREQGIELFETVIFPRSYIDKNGVLILDLNETKPVRRKNKYGR